MRRDILPLESRPFVSFVIPVLNEESRLPALLTDLRNEFPSCECIVVDGGSGDGSVAAAMPQADCVLLGAPGRALQMNLGAACARGEWLGFLHADTKPQFNESSLRAALTHEMLWAFCRIRLQGRSRGLPMVSAFINQRSRVTRVATGDQLLFVQRALFEEIQGFREIPLMEDVDISKRLRASFAGGRVDLEVQSSGRRWDELGLWPTIFRMWALRLAFFAGVSPVRLWAHYYDKNAVPAARARR